MAQRCAAGTDLGFTRDRRSYAQVGQARLAWIVTICGGPGSAMHRSTSLRAAPRPGRDSVGRVRSLIHFSNSPSRSRGAFLHPGFATLLHSPQTRGGRSAEKRSGACKAPVRHAMTRHARRLRGALRPMTRDARLSALHRGGFGPRGRASLTDICAGSVTASSSQPGRSAWRAGSRASRGERLRAAAAGRHSPLRLQDVSGRRPSMSEDGNL